MNDKKFKIATAVLIIGAGLVGSYLIIKDSTPLIESKKESIIQEGVKKVKEALAQNPIKWIENGNRESGGDNLTENLSKIVFEQVRAGAFSDANSVSTPDIRSILQNKNLELNLIFDIDDSQLKISQDNSREAKIKYLNAIGEINKKNLGDFNKNYLEIIIDVFQKIDMSSAIRAADIYKSLANDYLEVATPKDWINIHKALIIHYKNAEAVYSAFAEYKNDPIKGYLALEVIENIVKNGAEIQNLANQKIEEIQ